MADRDSQIEKAGGSSLPRITRARRFLAAKLPPVRKEEDTEEDEKTSVMEAESEGLADVEPEVQDLLLQEAGHLLDNQHSTITQLDTKAAGLLAAGVALATYLLASAGGWLVLIALVADAGLMIFALTSLGVRTWSDAPKPSVLPRLVHGPLNQVTARIMQAKIVAYNENKKNLDAKSDWVKIATWSLGLCVVCAALTRL